MQTIAILILAFASLLVGVLVEPPAAKAAKVKPTVVTATAPAASETGKDYRILSEDVGTSGFARFVAVQLPRRLAEADLERIADEVRSKEKAAFEKTIVNFYLPGMKTGGNGWAAAIYNPSLKVTVLGLRLDEEQAALAEASQDKRALVGIWLTAPPAPPGRLAIYREGERLFVEWKLRNGTLSVEQLAQTRDERGRRLTPLSGSGEHFLLTAGGDLELRDDTSLIAMAERLPGFGDAAAPVKPVVAARPRSSSSRMSAASKPAATTFVVPMSNF